MSSITNTRYPHHVRIYRTDRDYFKGDETETVLYDGKCRKEPNRTGGYAEKVTKGDYRMSIPGTGYDIRTGDRMDIDEQRVSFMKVVVTDAYMGNLGTTVWFNLTKN